MNNTGCIIGRETTVRGNITGNEPIVIEGRVEGSLSSTQSLVVEPNGFVEATLETDELTVHGTVQGNISSSKGVFMRNTAKVVGNIRASKVVIEDGARFKGHIEMDVTLPDGLDFSEET